MPRDRRRRPGRRPCRTASARRGSPEGWGSPRRQRAQKCTREAPGEAARRLHLPLRHTARVSMVAVPIRRRPRAPAARTWVRAPRRPPRRAAQRCPLPSRWCAARPRRRPLLASWPRRRPPWRRPRPGAPQPGRCWPPRPRAPWRAGRPAPWSCGGAAPCLRVSRRRRRGVQSSPRSVRPACRSPSRTRRACADRRCSCPQPAAARRRVRRRAHRSTARSMRSCARPCQPLRRPRATSPRA